MNTDKFNKILRTLIKKQHDCILSNNPAGASKALYQVYQLLQQTCSPNLTWDWEIPK